ncbi:MAG: ATP-dependent helicase [Verrucomicrobiales bacterium]
MAREYTLAPRAGSGSSIDFQAELNEQQYAAVTCPPGPALVIAGAGSGKTRTLTYRVAYLLGNGVEAENILLLTFTNKAAREMLQRVDELVSADTSRLWGGTFHSIGNRLLRRHPERVGYRSNFSILDREDQKDLVATAIVECEIDPKALRFPKPDVLINMFSLAVNTEIELGEIVDTRYPYFAHLGDAIHKVSSRFAAKKHETNTMDFDDLLVKSLELLRKNPDLAESYQHQFQFILVDEYQDTNRIQADFIDLLAGKHGNLMVVGDDAQSIYSWRGADFRNILEFPKRYPKAQVYRIESNYRSVPEILRFSNAAIAMNVRQFEKELVAVRPEREFLPALVPLNDPSTQAAFVAQRILELRDEGIELDEIAVLYRAHFHAMEIQMELTSRGIPFVITSGLRFFEQAHIKDVAAFMKFALNRSDEVAFKRMVRMLPGIGSRSAEKLWGSWAGCKGANEAQLGSFSKYLLDFKVPAKGRKPWEQLAYTLDELIENGVPAKPAEMIRSILEGVYEDYLRSKFTNYESRRQDLEQLMSYGGSFESMEEFLAQLALLTGVDAEGRKGGQERDQEAVCLSSVHQAKGLEWRAVFIVWLAEGMFPNARALEADDGTESLEEERRLFYVAATRAKDELYLSYPRIWPSAHSGDVVQRPSRFLEEIPAELVEQWEVGRGF